MTDEELARKFHDTYERLAPSFGYETRLDTKMFDPESKNGKLMIAVCAEVCADLRAEKASWGRIADDAVTESERLRAERDVLAGLAREARDALDAIANKDGTDRWLLACEIDAALAAQERKL